MAQEKYRKTEKRPQSSAVKKTVSSEEKKRREAKRREEARIAAENRRRAKIARKKRRTRIFAISFALSLVFVVIYWAWVAFSILGRDAISEDALPLLVYTDGERKEDLRFEAEEVTFGDEVFLPVTVLEEYTAVSIFGDYDTRSFLIRQDGEYATFALNSPSVLVNGQKVSTKSSAFLKDDVLYIPVDFFTDKMSCFSYTHSSALAANVLTYLPQEGISFVFREMPASPTVDAATVPVIPTVPETPEAA